MSDEISMAPLSQLAVEMEPVVAVVGGEGGVQGLRWHDDALVQDSDGDWAHAFLQFPPNPQPFLRSKL